MVSAILEVQSKLECRALQNILEQKKTIPNEDINKDILSVFNNFEIFFYYFSTSKISMTHIVDVLILKSRDFFLPKNLTNL